MDLFNMSFGQLLHLLDNEELKKEIRNFEKQKKHIISAKYGIIFNQTCLNEGLYPTFTNFKLHDPEARHESFSMKYRRDLIQFQLNKHKNTVDHINSTIMQLEPILARIPEPDLRRAIATKLTENEAHDEAVTSSRITNKLNKLYKGTIAFPTTNRTHINLSDTELTNHQNDILSLGIKCHYKPKFDPLKKQVELEILYDTLINMHNKGIIHINPNLKYQLRAEATKQRDFSKSSILTKDLIHAAKTLKNHQDII